ncbi:hypothetical protein NDU88_000902 [Pleurodeles waltl]|uniref:Uncharacterized protein n=1 Tax=Pleurodeles waltl TaxID=8319 RepID=A0AAV7KPJ2_PLEWA|nr:hypothetical protein NDU88_000902 [Pleurodeles waltl]
MRRTECYENDESARLDSLRVLYAAAATQRQGSLLSGLRWATVTNNLKPEELPHHLHLLLLHLSFKEEDLSIDGSVSKDHPVVGRIVGGESIDTCVPFSTSDYSGISHADDQNDNNHIFIVDEDTDDDFILNDVTGGSGKNFDANTVTSLASFQPPMSTMIPLVAT